jgi:hypothetical protein
VACWVSAPLQSCLHHSPPSLASSSFRQQVIVVRSALRALWQCPSSPCALCLPKPPPVPHPL